MAANDRLERLLAQNQLNGIDFVEIATPSQTTLVVHFLNALPALQGQVRGATIDGGTTVRSVPVHPIQAADWGADAGGRPLLTLRVDAPGDFSLYTLRLDSDLLDPFFAQTVFSFKALCPSPLDCREPPAPCPPDDDETPPIDYLAKDFLSFGRALQDFSALRYPEWQERSEADFGVMFREALAALADDLSYTQDRVAAEATLDTATQRVSVVRHARLVDYEPRPATAARVLLQFDVTGGPVPAGLVVSGQAPDGTAVYFETGDGLADPQTGAVRTDTFAVSPLWNRGALVLHFWDDSRRCLRAGDTQLWVEGWNLGLRPGQRLLLDTRTGPGEPPLRELIRLAGTEQVVDPLPFTDPPAAVPPLRVTRLFWDAKDAPARDHDLTQTDLVGNLVPATHGRRYSDTFALAPGGAAPPGAPLAVFRTGPNGVKVARYTLSAGALAWLAPAEKSTAPGGDRPLPEVALVQLAPGPPAVWRWRRWPLDAEVAETAFTLEPARYGPTGVAAPDGTPIQDYDGPDGDTLRFGDGTFGALPGPQSLFRVTYRVGGGARGNVAPDTLTRFDPAATGGLVRAVTNPFAATGGQDAEPDERVRRLAPQAFQAVQYRAVRAEDYEKAAQTLPWVQRAGTVFRWTGSWLTVFTTADPRGTDELSVGQQTELINLLNRYRLAGYESYVSRPRYAPLDVGVYVCARTDAFAADVERDVRAALRPRPVQGGPGPGGFFDYDNFTFGTPLERSALEAAVQRVPGVAGVTAVTYRRRGHTQGYVDMPEVVAAAPNEVLLVEDNPSRPANGSLCVHAEGGK